jgi:hypothetical protein
MKDRIIKIVELGEPQSLIQRENAPTTELIKTNLLIEELNEQLRLCNVVGGSEQLICDHPDEAIIRDKPTDYCLACNSNI